MDLIYSIADFKVGMTVAHHYTNNYEETEYCEVQKIEDSKAFLKRIYSYKFESINPLTSQDVFKAYTAGRIADPYLEEFRRDCKLVDRTYDETLIINNEYCFFLPSSYFWTIADIVKGVPNKLEKAYKKGLKDGRN